MRELIRMLENIAEVIYQHSGVYLPRWLRYYFSLAVDLFDLWILGASLLATAIGALIPGAAVIAQPLLMAVGFIQVLAAVILWGRDGLAVIAENILTVAIGWIPFLGILIEIIPMTLIAGWFARRRAVDNRSMIPAITQKGKAMQRIAIIGGIWYGFLILPWIWDTLYKFWKVISLVFGIIF